MSQYRHEVPSSSTLPKLEPRKLTDPRAMRAVAHPVRIALLEVLGTEGPLTATQAGELIGESPTTCSFHLRQLAKYGFIEEVAGVAGRKRPWRLVHTGMSFSDVSDDPETRLAATALTRVLHDVLPRPSQGGARAAPRHSDRVAEGHRSERIPALRDG